MTFPINSGTQLILADHYNAIRNNLYSVLGPNDQGYGLIRLESTEIDSRYIVKANSRQFVPGWKNIMYFLNAVSIHQSGQEISYQGQNLNDLILVNTGTNISEGIKISADLTNFLYNKSQEIVSNRFSVFSSELTHYTPLNGQSTRASSWGDGTLEPSIDHVVEAEWTSFYEMQSFFNLGGYVQIELEHANNANDTISNQWKGLIESLGLLTYTRTDFLGSLVKYYPIVDAIRPDAINGDIYLSIHVTAVRSDLEPKITFAISLNDLPDLNVNQVNGPSLVIIPKKERWFVDILGSSDLTNLTIDPLLEDSGISFDDQNFSESLVTLQFDNDGTFEIVSTGGRANFASTWGTPVRPKNGDNYWIRFTKLSSTATGFYSISNSTTWQQLNQRRSVSIQSNTLNYSGNSRAEASYKVEISSNSSGSPIVSQGTYTLISEALGNQFVPVLKLQNSGYKFFKRGRGSVGTGLVIYPNGTIIIGSITIGGDPNVRDVYIFDRINWGNPVSHKISGLSDESFILSESNINLYNTDIVEPGTRYWWFVTRTEFGTNGTGTFSVTNTFTEWVSLSEAVAIRNVATTKNNSSYFTAATFDIKIAEDSEGVLVVSTASYTFISESQPLE